MTPATLTMIRKAEKQSISAFALRLGISRNTMGGYEKGKQPIPNYIALAAMAIYRRVDGIGSIWSTLGGLDLIDY